MLPLAPWPAALLRPLLFLPTRNNLRAFSLVCDEMMMTAMINKISPFIIFMTILGFQVVSYIPVAGNSKL